MLNGWYLKLAVLILLAGTCSPAYAQAGKDTVLDLVSLFCDRPGCKVSSDTSLRAARRIDYADMSETAIGSANWEKLTPADRREFITAFRGLVEKRYYPRWH